MRWQVALALALATTLASAGDPYAVLLDWQHGETLVGTSALVMSPVAHSFAFEVDACRRDIIADLLYAPAEAGADADGIGEVFLEFDFLAEIWAGDTMLARQRIRQPAYEIPLATAPAAGPHEIRLSLANGANVSWDLRVRGHAVFEEIACEPRVVINEVEANPAGADAAHEWIEILNAGDEPADLSGWVVRAMHGAPADLALPQGVTLAAGAHLVVTFTGGQALDNVDEVVELRDALGRVRDATPASSDTSDDARAWQRASDGSHEWIFSVGTPGASNG